MTDKERESSTERHAYGFMTLEPMIRDLERYAILLGDHIDEDAGETGTILAFKVQEMCTELR
jgi:hypothetical protein